MLHDARGFSSTALLLALLIGGAGCGEKKVGPFSPDKDHVEILFAGDLSVARGLAETIDKNGGDVTYPFKDIQPVLDTPDLVFANLECVLSDSDDEKAPKTYTIRAPLRYASKLKETGIDVVSVSNNHSLDFGYQGFWSTLAEAKRQGIGVTGVQTTEDGPQEPLIVQVGKMKVGFIGYNAHGDEYKVAEKRPRPELYKIKRIIENIKRVRPMVDQLVVSVHWGPELSHWPWDWQVKDAHAMIDAGADFVIGHHPHVPEPVEEYKNGLIVYSLGDFLFDKSSAFLRNRTGDRFFVKVKFDGKKRTGFELLPINHDQQWRPHLEEKQDTASWILKPETAAWVASDHIEDAIVSRVGGPAAGPCDKFSRARPKLAAGYMRWLEQRWLCGNDDNIPGRGVGRSAELSGTVMHTGIWASPENDVVHLEFKDVPLAGTITGFAGFTDFPVEKERKEKSPATITVKAGDVELKKEITFAKGWNDLTLDTTKLAGIKQTITIDVAGAKREEHGFVFDLKVPK